MTAQISSFLTAPYSAEAEASVLSALRQRIHPPRTRP